MVAFDGESLWPLLYAGLVFTVPLTLASFALGLAVAFATHWCGCSGRNGR